jgi:hypothetical protein
MAVLGHAFRTKASSCFVFNFLHIPPYGELTIKNRVLQICFFFTYSAKFIMKRVRITQKVYCFVITQFNTISITTVTTLSLARLNIQDRPFFSLSLSLS